MLDYDARERWREAINCEVTFAALCVRHARDREDLGLTEDRTDLLAAVAYLCAALDRRDQVNNALLKEYADQAGASDK